MPVVNGYEFAFDSVTFRIGGHVADYIENVSWSDDCAVTEVRGTGGRLVDLVPGTYTARGSVTLPKSREEEFLSAIGVAVTLCVPFTLSVSTVVEGRLPLTDTLEDVILTGRRDSHASRSGVLVVSFDFRARKIRTNRRLPVP